MKRKKELETLSWEHHNGLVAAFRLQQGLKKKTDLNVMREYILNIWENELLHHFWMEEEVLIEPLKLNTIGQKLLKQLLNEHSAFREEIRIFSENGFDLADRILDFAIRLNKHIRFEERELFPFIESNLTEQKLNEVSQFLHSNHKPECNNWQQQFWK